MTWKAHMVQAAIASAILAPFLTFKSDAVLFLSIIFIDIDHYLDFVMVCHRFDVRDMFKYHDWVWEQKDRIYGLSAFHTIEVFMLLFLLGFRVNYAWVILSGFLIHMFFDLISLYWHGIFFGRAFSIIEYIIKRKTSNKGYPTPPPGFWD